jgi:hypothetical protein
MATAEKALWDYAKRTGALTEGAPRIWEGRDSANAPSIIIYLDENRVELVGGWRPGPMPDQAKEKWK